MILGLGPHSPPRIDLVRQEPQRRDLPPPFSPFPELGGARLGHSRHLLRGAQNPAAHLQGGLRTRRAQPLLEGRQRLRQTLCDGVGDVDTIWFRGSNFSLTLRDGFKRLGAFKGYTIRDESGD
jgi:hypothetical protein